MADIPTTEPLFAIAGDTLKFLRSVPDYPASAGWSLGYTLVEKNHKITFGSTASGDDYLVNVSAATTATWAAHQYAWRAQVSKAGEVYTVGEGRIEIKASFAGNHFDTRSVARQGLEAIEAYLINVDNFQASQYEIAGRSLRRYSMTELLALRDRFKAEVLREEAAQRVANGLPDTRRVFVRFGP